MSKFERMIPQLSDSDKGVRLSGNSSEGEFFKMDVQDFRLELSLIQLHLKVMLLCLTQLNLLDSPIPKPQNLKSFSAPCSQTHLLQKRIFTASYSLCLPLHSVDFTHTSCM